MIPKTLKPILCLGLYAIFISCSNADQKTTEQKDDSLTAAPSVPATAETEESSETDTTKKDGLAENQAAKTEAPAKAEAKPKEPVSENASKKTGSAESKPAAAQKAVVAENPNIKKGEMLISKSDCFACHKVDEKLVGPAYTEVAKKYEASSKNVEYLAGKIINGGSGVWGEVFMAPHPSVSQEDARAMAEYILSLR